MAARSDIEAGNAFVRLYLKDDFSKRLGKSMKVAAKAVATAGVAIGGALVAMAKKSATAALELDKLSKQTGESLEGLQELRFVASRTGVEFDDLIGLIEEMNIRLGEAASRGTGPLAEAFEELGLSAKEIAQLNPADAIERIADALNRIPNQARRRFLVDEVFGGDGFKALSLLERGSEGIRKLREEASTPIDQEAVNRAKEFTKAWADFNVQMTAVSQSIGNAVLPALTSMLDKLNQFIEDAGTSDLPFFRILRGELRTEFGIELDPYRRLASQLKDATSEMDKLNESQDEFIENARKRMEARQEIIDAAKERTKQRDQLAAGIAQLDAIGRAGMDITVGGGSDLDLQGFNPFEAIEGLVEGMQVRGDQAIQPLNQILDPETVSGSMASFSASALSLQTAGLNTIQEQQLNEQKKQNQLLADMLNPLVQMAEDIAGNEGGIPVQ